ncbi:MAG TPA: Uma2 family endonuclease [Chthoniobacteraceae bacterium]|jgi:Uma2 family endonuclease|nr:Uma2 family endonuclease [Chthoniobacteraceae bacterium]
MSIVDAPTYHWTVEEYERLGEGFFGRKRVELLNGEIIEKMSPMGYPHGEAVDRLVEFFILMAKGRYRVRSQAPFILSEDSMPEPDVCLYKKPKVLRHHPKTEHLFLAIEVADSTLRFDRGDKKRAYALQGIPEYWILNLQDDMLEVHRAPVGDQYTTSFTLGGEEIAAPLAFPDVNLRVGDYIP